MILAEALQARVKTCGTTLIGPYNARVMEPEVRSQYGSDLSLDLHIASIHSAHKGLSKEMMPAH